MGGRFRDSWPRRRVWPSALGVSFLLGHVALATPGSALGGTPSSGDVLAARTSWRAPAGCTQAEEFRDGVERNLRRDRVPETRRIDGRMVATQAGFEVVFTVSEAGEVVGRRVLHFEVATCRETDEATQLVAAMLLESGLSAQERREHQEEQDRARAIPSASKPEPRPGARPPEPVPPVAGSPSPPSLRPWLGVQGAVTAGMTPQVAAALRLETGLRWGRHLSAYVQAGLPNETTSGRTSTGKQVAVAGFFAFGGACVHPLARWRGLAACTGVGWVWLQGVGRGVSVATPGAWNQGTLGLALRATGNVVGPWDWALGVRLEAPFERARFVAAGPGDPEELHLTAGAFGSSFVGLQATF